MDFDIKRLTPELAEDYFDFFDNRAFSDGSPFYPCYCNAYNLSKDRINTEIIQKAREYGGGQEGWKRALRESAERMVASGEIQGYLAYDHGTAEGYRYAEAYPVQDGGYLGKAFTGPMHLYEKAGFVVCAQIHTTYVMRKNLSERIEPGNA